MSYQKTTVLFLLGIFLLSCKTQKKEPDNIYQYKNYISYTTSGYVSKTTTFDINFRRFIDQWSVGDELPENIVSVHPKTKGKVTLENVNSISFTPSENLQPDTEYTITVRLDQIYKGVAEEQKTYTFACKTIKPNFTVSINNLQSHSKDWQFVEGIIKSADMISLEEAKKLITAKQKGNDIKLMWNESFQKSKYFDFRIDSILRKEENDEVLVKWNGKSIQSDISGEETITILGKNNFKVTNVEVVQGNEQYIAINFSDPIQKSQNFKGLVTIQNAINPKFVVDGNLLKVYYDGQLTGTSDVNVYEGIKNADGYKLKETVAEVVAFEELKPQIRFVSSGNILPNSDNLKLNFEAVNLSAVDVRIIKVFNDNVLQFLQYNNLNGSSNIKRVGRRIIKKTIQLIQDKSQNTKSWKAYSIDLSQLFKADPGAIYRVELNFLEEYSLYDCEGATNVTNVDTYKISYEDQEEKEEQYWDNKLYNYRNYSYNWHQRDNPCHAAYYNYSRTIAQNLVASNLGVIAKRGNQKNYFFAVSDILSAQPIAGAKVALYNYQQQKFHQTTTNSEGIAQYDSDKEAYFAIVSKGNNATYVRLNDGNSLSLSKFDVSGVKTQKGIKGFIYGERGVWRPGDSIHLNFVLNDNDNKLPKNHPVKIEVRDPNGKLVHKEVTTEHVNQFYSFPFTTTAESTTGVYRALVSVGGAKFSKDVKVETIKPNRLKINLDFGKEVFSANTSLKGKLQINWLHGAPARNIKAEIDAKISNTKISFKGFEDYIFNDPTRSYYTEDIRLFDGNVNENGFANITEKLSVGKNAPGMLRVNFLVKAYENGGDFSIDAFSKKYAPYATFVGMQKPKADDYGFYTTGSSHRFEVATVTDQGKPFARKNIEVKVYKIEWRWWWNSGRGNLSTYNSDRYHRPYKTIKLNTNSNGKGFFKLKIPIQDRGRYLVRVIDPVSGHATGDTMYFYDNWWEDLPTDDKEAAKMLVFNADKESYQVGETAKITFPSAHVAKALISLENGSEVIQHQWVNTQKGKTVVEIPITKKMTPNFFVNISLLQPHAKVENDLPIRLYGTIPVKVEDPNTRLQPVISMPTSLEPEKEFEVAITEKQSRAMTYTLAVVEEGLLDLTRFRTPNAHSSFYAREALGVRTWDMYDDVIGAYSGSIDQVFAIGGDGTSSAAKNRKANRFKPVVKHLGPFTLKAGEKKVHKITLPNYIGSVRAMVVAGNATSEAYGNAEKTVPVKKPLMVLASLPRKLSPGEKVTLPVTVFATEKNIKQVSVQLQLSNGIEVVGQKESLLNFSKTGEQMAYFTLDVSNANGINTIDVIAKSGLKTAKYQVEIDVENPNPIASKVINKVVQANGVLTLDFETFGVTGTNSAAIQISTVPHIDFDRRLSYLIQYPHGCVEQTTSSVFPQLFMSDLFDLSSKRKNRIQQNIKQGIKRLSHFQRSNGGLSYWIGESTGNDWGTSYAGHFMLEAEKKGFILPFGFKVNWIRFQREAARNWRPNPRYSNDLNQAYRLYTLALAGSADLGAMNRLREYENISNEAKWRLAAAYGLIGQKQASKELANTSSLEFVDNSYYSYGSVTRNKAMALETMVILQDDRRFELAKSIAKDLSSDRWMSTQTTSYSLLAMSKMMKSNGGKSIKASYQFKGSNQQVETSKTIVNRELNISKGKNKLQLKNLQNNTLYVSLVYKGKLPLGSEIPIGRGFSAEIKYALTNGTPITINQLKQGQDFVATVTVTNLKNERVKDVALSQIFPSGWEIVNTRFTDFGSSVESKARHTDIRDDRVNFYFDMGRRGTSSGKKTFSVLLNASYLGTYYLPGLQVEAMYDNDYLVRTKGKWINVVK